MKTSFQKYKVLLDNSVSAILFTKPDGSIIEVNEAAQEMFGYSPQEFITLGRKGIIDHTDENLPILITEREATGKIKGELTGIRKNGEKFPIRFTSALFIDEGEELYCTTIQDISERKKSEQEMVLMIDNTEESFVLLDTNLRIVSFNTQFQNLGKRYFGFDAKNGDYIIDYAPQDQAQELKEFYTLVLKGSKQKKELVVPTDNGEIKYFIITYTPTIGNNNAVTSIFISARDITEETESQLAIKETKAELDKIMDFSLDIICTIDDEGKFVKVSNASEKIWGYTPDELVGKNYIDYVHPDDLRKTLIAAHEIIAGFDQTNFQNRCIKKDGTIVPVIWSAKWDDAEKMMFCIAKDATEKEKQEAALIESEKLYKNLFENSPVPMLIFDFETLQIIDCNEETLLKYEYTKEEFLKLTIKNIRPPEDIEKIEKAVADEATYGQIHKNVWHHQKKNGEIMFMDISAHLITYNDRRMSLAMLIDVTDKLKAEEQKEFEKRDKEALINSTNDLIWSVSKDFKLIAANQAFINSIHEQIGFNIKSGDSLLIEEAFSIEYINFWKAFYLKTLAGISFKEEVKSPPTLNREEVWYDIAFNPIYKNDEVVGIACYARNITESKRFEQELINSEEKYRLVFCNSPVPKWVYELETLKIVDVNETAIEHYGYSKEEFMSMNLKDLRAEEEIIKLEKSVGEAQKKEGIFHSGVFTHRKKNGEFIKVEVSGHNIAYQDKKCRIVVCNDVTIRERALSVLKDREAKLRSAQQIAKLGYWQLNIETGDLFWSTEVYKIWGLSKNIKPNFELFTSTIHPDDIDAFMKAQNAALTGGIELNIEHRIVLKNGTVKWVHEKGKLQKDSAKKNILLDGTVQDITERKKTEEKLNESILRYENVTKATSDAIWDWDIVANKVFWGETFNHLFGKLDYETLSDENKEKKRLHPNEAEAVLKSAKDAIKSTILNWSYEHRYLKADGKYAYVTNRAVIVRDEKGNAIRVVGAMQDITQRKLEEQQLKLMSSVVTNTNDAVLITEAEPFDEPGPKILYVNEAFTKMTGYTAAEVIGKNPRILQGPKSDKRELARLRKALENWESCEITTINYKKNGEEFWINFTISPVADEKGWFTHWISIDRDITIRKNEELQNELIADISAVFNEPIKLHETLDKTLRHITAFGGFCFAEAWLVGSDKTIINKVSTHAVTDNMKLFLEETNAIDTSIEGEGFAGIVAKTKEIILWGDLANQKQLRRREATLKYGLKTLIGLPMLHNNEVIGVLAFGLDFEVQDTTKYLTLFKALVNYLAPEIKRKQLEQELNQLFNFAPDVIVIVGLDGYFKRINPAACKILGYTQEELCSVPYADFIHPEDKNITNDELEIVLENNHTFYFENRYITKSGKIKWLTWNATYSKEENSIYAVAKDITEKKELEDLLKKANELAKIGGWEVDLQTNTVFWSDITKEIHEVTPDYVPKLKTGINFYKKGTHRKAISQYVKQAFENGAKWDDEFQIITAKGNERWVRVIGEVEKVNGNYNRMYGSFQDINERKIAEEKIKNSEERRTLIMNAALDAIICIDNKGMITFWNPQAEQIFGWSENEVMGKLLSSIIIPESHRVLHDNGMKNYLKTGNGPVLNVLLQLSAKRKGGEEFPIELTVLPLRQDGEEFFCAFIRDITERKTYETRLIELNESLKKQKAELVVSNQELEQFANIASHDLQEPLRMVTSFLTLLDKKHGQNFDEDAKKYVHYAVDGAKRMRQLILDLLEYSTIGKTEQNIVLINLNELIDEIKILYSKKLEELGATLQIESLPSLKWHKAPVFQLFQNLISNALKYNRKGISPEIKIAVISVNNYWQFSVEDNGIGIEKEYFEKIFVIFQRLHNKDEYSGTGMGLALTKKIVESLGGKIWLESTVNKGSTFYFTIPKNTI